MGGIQSNKIQFELLSLLICSNFIYSPHILLSSLAFISDEMFAERIYNVPSIVRFYRLQLKDGEKHFERSDGEIFTSFYSAPHLVRLYFSFEWLFTLSITVPFNRSNKKNSLEILVWHNFSIHCYIAYFICYTIHRKSFLHNSIQSFLFHLSRCAGTAWHIFVKDTQNGDDCRGMRENSVNMKFRCDGCWKRWFNGISSEAYFMSCTIQSI